MLYQKLSKLRLLAAVLYDQGTVNGLTEEQKALSIAPIHEQLNKLIHDSIESDLGDVIAAVKHIERDVVNEHNKAHFYQEKAQEAKAHANHIMEMLATNMLAKGETERIHGNYMAVITDGELKIR